MIGVGLEKFVAKRTLKMFNGITEQGKESAESFFLWEDPRKWETNIMFLEMKKSEGSLKVLYDGAEIAVSLIWIFNTSLTKDEEQKQYLHSLIANHLRRLSAPIKVQVIKEGNCRVVKR